MLIGEPGVGKTAIAEGLALRIVDGDVPESLKNKPRRGPGHGRAGRRHQVPRRVRGAAQGRAQGSRGDAGNVILFIDELHTVVGAGRAEGGSDAANLLKPALARGDLRCIGATTLDEYRKYVEKDAALERRFQPVTVGEPSVEDTIAILRGLKPRYEAHHKGVKIKDSALVAAAKLSHRYIADRFLPDKAIDLMDEATSRLAMELESVPARDRRGAAAAGATGTGRSPIGRRDRRARQSSGPRSRRKWPSCARSWPSCASSGNGRRAAWATSSSSASELDDVELRFNQLAAAIKEKQSSGMPCREADYQKLYELDMKRKKLSAAARIGEPASPTTGGAACSAGSRPGGNRRSRQRLDRHPRLADDGDRAGETAGAGRADPPAAGRPGRGRGGRVQRGPPQPLGPARPQPADRLVHLPRAHRRGQDRAVQGPGRGDVRRRKRHGPARHERVHGAAHREPADRRPAGLRGLRGRGPADRGHPPPALLPSSSWTKSRRPTATCSTSCCKSSTTAA